MGKIVKVEREFNSTAQKIWEAWTNPEIIAKWWAPEGLLNGHASVDLRVGGEFRYCMVAPDGTEYWGKGTYTKLNEPHYLEYIDTFTDKDGNPVSPSFHNMSGDEILETTLSVEIEELGSGKVKMTITMEAYEDEKSQKSAMQGWNSMLELFTEVVE